MSKATKLGKRDFPWGAPTQIVTWLLSYVVLRDHVTN